MDLFHRDFGGEGDPIIILHGLFGSSRNWTTIGRELSRLGHVSALDARNHGESPHHPSHSLSDMQGDLSEWMEKHDASNALLMGHSMGGLTAASYALKDSSRLAGLVVVDIAPRSYPPHHDAEFKALSMDVSRLATRTEVDREMTRYHADPMIRQFLQMNLERRDLGYRWKLNLPALKAARFLNEDDFRGTTPVPALFVAGGLSNYITQDDHALIRSHFPNAEIALLDQADHYMHYTSHDKFLTTVAAWMGNLRQNIHKADSGRF